MKKILKYLSIFFAIFLLVYLLYVFNFYFDGIGISSSSMEPTIMTNQRVRAIAPNPFRKPRVGDIISFTCKNTSKCSEGETMHRLTAIHPDGCMEITGDNQPIAWDTNDYGCLMPDEIDIIGIVVDIIK